MISLSTFSNSHLLYMVCDYMRVSNVFSFTNWSCVFAVMNLLQMLSSKDINFVGYTYKNFEIVNDHQLPGIGNCLSLLVCIHM